MVTGVALASEVRWSLASNYPRRLFLVELLVERPANKRPARRLPSHLYARTLMEGGEFARAIPILRTG
jgi:hypothetical protein